MKAWAWAVAALAALAWPAGRAAGQEAGVAAEGAAAVRKMPDRLRVVLQLMAKGKDLKEAVAKLKARREAATAELVKLGAAKESIVLGEPNVTQLMGGRPNFPRGMPFPGLPQVGGVPAVVEGGQGDKAAKLPVIVAQSCRADWPLKAAAAEELLLTVQPLQDKLKAADLIGLKELTKPATPQEEEALEEARGMMMEQGGQMEPVFLFLTRVTEAEREQALTEAYRKAEAEATRLAKIAGRELGPLRQLSQQNARAQNVAEYANNGIMAAMAPQDEDLAEGEAVGLQAGKVTYRVTVTTTFALKAK